MLYDRFMEILSSFDDTLLEGDGKDCVSPRHARSLHSVLKQLSVWMTTSYAIVLFSCQTWICNGFIIAMEHQDLLFIT
jgi:hypothetical protein